MKRTIEIDDTLEENVMIAIDSVKQELLHYLKDNGPFDTLPDFGSFNENGAVDSLIDSATPVYTSEIKDTWYLNRSDLLEAYSNADVGQNPLHDNGRTAIYYYIQNKVCEWYEEIAQEVFNGFQTDETGSDN